MRFFFLLILAALPLSSAALTVEPLTAKIPEMTRTAYTPPTQSVTFTGILFAGDQAAITVKSEYPEDDLFHLLAQLLAFYQKGDVQGSVSLYSTASLPAIKAFIKNNGEEWILEVTQKITALRPRILWIDAPGTVICYVQIDNEGNCLPFMLTRENGQWKLMAGLLDSQFSKVISYLSMYRLWDKLEVSQAETGSPLFLTTAVEDKAFGSFPVLSPQPEPSAPAGQLPANRE